MLLYRLESLQPLHFLSLPLLGSELHLLLQLLQGNDRALLLFLQSGLLRRSTLLPVVATDDFGVFVVDLELLGRLFDHAPILENLLDQQHALLVCDLLVLARPLRRGSFFSQLSMTTSVLALIHH